MKKKWNKIKKITTNLIVISRFILLWSSRRHFIYIIIKINISHGYGKGSTFYQEEHRQQPLNATLTPRRERSISVYTWSIVKFVRRRLRAPSTYTHHHSRDTKNYNNMINIRINWWRLMAINNIFIVPFSSNSLTKPFFSYLFLLLLFFCCGEAVDVYATHEIHRPYGEIWFKDAYQFLFFGLFGFFSLETRRSLKWHTHNRLNMKGRFYYLCCFSPGNEFVLWNILSVSCNKISFQRKLKKISKRNQKIKKKQSKNSTVPSGTSSRKREVFDLWNLETMS